MSKLHEAAGLGQSIWLKGIDRPFIHNHHLLNLIQLGVHGVTTHPKDTAKALAGSSDYDHQLIELVHKGNEVKEIAEKLLFTDVQTAVAACFALVGYDTLLDYRNPPPPPPLSPEEAAWSAAQLQAAGWH